MNDFQRGFQEELEKIALGSDAASIRGGKLHISIADNYKPTWLAEGLPTDLKPQVRYRSEPWSRGRTAQVAEVSIPVSRAKDIPSMKPYIQMSMRRMSLPKKLYYKIKTADASTGKIYEKIEVPDDGSVLHFPTNDKPTPTTDHRSKVITDASVLGKMRASAFDA